jgi:menaquinone-dependent protoporphyrinogen oxidase
MKLEMALMEGKVLVAYATKNGSTEEVAEAVAATLREGGLEVEIRRAREVRTLEGYRGVVLGAPLYMFRWHKDARGFMARQRDGLMGRRTAVFALGPLHDDEKDRLEVRAQLDKELAKFTWLAPVAVAIFGGKFDPAKLTFPYNLIPALKRMPVSDIRDWPAIRAWADSICPLLVG